jgi:aminoglycoside 2'-N-acetyltransferase I
VADVRILDTGRLSGDEREAIRRLLEQAFDGNFTQDDWDHALGGWHALVQPADSILAHASVVERRIFIGSRPFRSGYVEAVAVQRRDRRRGLGTAVMTAIDEIIRREFELGVLSSGHPHFYERLGWERWRGPTYVRGMDGRRRRTADEDDGIMVLRCAASRAVDPAAPIMCEERRGDVW